MSEEESTTETTIEAPAETVTEKTSESKPSGYEPIDPNTATPEQTKERLDYLYGQVKHSDREKREMRKILSDQSRVIDELSRGQELVVNHLTTKSFADNKEQLKVAMQDAWKKGDNTAYIEAQNKLMDLQVEERLAAKQPKQSPQNKQLSAAEIARGAAETGELSDTEYRTTEAWQNERDESGNPLRPWAFDSDPTYKAALYEAQAVFASPRFSHLSHEQKLAEIDRRMGTARRTTSQAVMGGNLTKPTKNTKITLTPKQSEIALKTKYAGRGKSEAEHLEAYKKQIEKYSQRRAK